MRKLKLQMQVSIDGFAAGTQGEMDWMVWNWDDSLKNYVIDLTDSIDSILIGRKMADGFITHWAGVAANPSNPEYSFGKKMTDAYKVVFTKTLENSTWENTDLAKGDLETEINRLKNQSGKDIIVYGGGNIVSNLIKHGLIDEYHLFVNPTILGTGMPIFQDLEDRSKMKLISAKPFECGIVVLCYEPA